MVSFTQLLLCIYLYNYTLKKIRTFKKYATIINDEYLLKK